MSFSSLGLSEPILRAVSERGYTQPTPIQTQAIPAVLAGGDLLAGAQTGTGKTAGFTLPMLERLSRQPAQPRAGRAPIRALVLVPTRELAAQVEESIRSYGRNLDIRSTVIFGGVSIGPQIDRLRERVDILVATPGRLLDHVQQKTVDLSRVEILVLDEADRMLDMGFIHDIRKVLALLPPRRQNLLFSATFPDEIRELADTLLHRPALIEVARRNAPAELVEQKVVRVERVHKAELLAHLVRSRDWHQVLVFTRTKHRANWLAEKLEKAGISALAIHGNKSQNARTRALKAFKDGELRVLVATDIAARGLDIVELPHVVNYEMPNVPEDYVHRIGRTGRAGLAGEALSLVSAEEAEFLAGIEKLLRRSLPIESVADFVPSAVVATQDDERRQPRNPRPHREGKTQGGNDRAPASERRGKPGPRHAQHGQKPAKANDGAQRRNSGPGQGGRAAPQRPPRRAARPRVEDAGAIIRIGEGGEIDGNVLAPGWKRDANGNLIPPPRPRDPDGNRNPPPGKTEKTGTDPVSRKSGDGPRFSSDESRGGSLKRRFGELRNAAAALLGRGRRDEI